MFPFSPGSHWRPLNGPKSHKHEENKAGYYANQTGAQVYPLAKRFRFSHLQYQTEPNHTTSYNSTTRQPTRHDTTQHNTPHHTTPHHTTPHHTTPHHRARQTNLGRVGHKGQGCQGVEAEGIEARLALHQQRCCLTRNLTKHETSRQYRQKPTRTQSLHIHFVHIILSLRWMGKHDEGWEKTVRTSCGLSTILLKVDQAVDNTADKKKQTRES